MMGDETGLVADIDRSTGEPKQTYRLPDGVKCIVGDGEYLYVGTNKGAIFDLTSGRPREVAVIEGFGQLFWIDICDGLIAASDANGNVGMLDCDGEVIWQKKDADGGTAGWLCRMDSTGIYHGTTCGVKKYDRRGNQLWSYSGPLDVAFGVQTQSHLWANGQVEKHFSPQQSLVVKLNKETGADEGRMQMSGISSCSVSPDGLRVYDAELNVQRADVAQALWSDAAWKGCDKGLGGQDLMTQVMHGDFLYAVGTKKPKAAVLRCYDLSQAALEGAARGGLQRSKSRTWNKQDAAAEGSVMQEAEETTEAEGKVVICCVKDGSKIRARVESPGHDAALNCQFPRNLREAGAKYVVDAVELAPSGDFYRCRGEPKRLRQ